MGSAWYDRIDMSDLRFLELSFELGDVLSDHFIFVGSDDVKEK